MDSPCIFKLPNSEDPPCADTSVFWRDTKKKALPHYCSFLFEACDTTASALRKRGVLQETYCSFAATSFIKDARNWWEKTRSFLFFCKSSVTLSLSFPVSRDAAKLLRNEII